MSASLSARAALVAPASRVASKSGKKQRAAARRPARTARAHRGLVVRAGDLDDELAAINAARAQVARTRARRVPALALLSAACAA